MPLATRQLIHEAEPGVKKNSIHGAFFSNHIKLHLKSSLKKRQESMTPIRNNAVDTSNPKQVSEFFKNKNILMDDFVQLNIS